MHLASCFKIIVSFWCMEISKELSFVVVVVVVVYTWACDFVWFSNISDTNHRLIPQPFCHTISQQVHRELSHYPKQVKKTFRARLGGRTPLV